MYYIPGNDNGKKNPPKKNKNPQRLLIKWVAVFLVIALVVFRLFHYHPTNQDVTHTEYNGHADLIDTRLLENKDFGLPRINQGDEIIRHFAYTLSYSESDEEAYWVAYTLKRDNLDGNEQRTNDFEADPDVPTGSAKPDDYRNSGYDKGHLAPAADMKWDKEAMKESFLLSNICPQDHKFNDGIWADLEKAVRKWATNDAVEYVVTGPVLPDSNDLKIGKDHVTVPSYFYKVIFSPNPYPKAVGFIIPNKPGKVSFWHYACTLSQVENRTHLNFFPMLPEKTSKRIKAQFDVLDWRSTIRFEQR